MPNYLWNFAPSAPSYSAIPGSPGGTAAGSTQSNASQNAVVPVPVLSYAGAGGAGTVNPPINVVRDFYWTYSPAGDAGRAEVPRIILTERRLKTNALVAQLKYSLGALSGGINAVSQDLSNASSKIPKLIQEMGSGAVNAANAAVTEANNLLGSIPGVEDVNSTVAGSPLLQPYRNLYITEPTGWVYVLPYFENSQYKQANQFSGGGGEQSKGPLANLIQKTGENITGFAETISSLASPLQVTYVERTKAYNYDTDGGEEITVEFPLINTGSVSYDDVVRNWQFLFLLVYQNRPGKTGFNTVDQPVIYQVEVPGTKFFPYCYISSLDVQFRGARREMKISIPTTTSSVNSTQTQVSDSSSSSNFSTIIPDAYYVTINLKSMTANTRNFMAYSISNHSVIETGVQ